MTIARTNRIEQTLSLFLVHPLGLSVSCIRVVLVVVVYDHTNLVSDVCKCLDDGCRILDISSVLLRTLFNRDCQMETHSTVKRISFYVKHSCRANGGRIVSFYRYVMYIAYVWTRIFEWGTGCDRYLAGILWPALVDRVR